MVELRLTLFQQVVPRYSAVIPGAANSESIPLDADHTSLVKYATMNDGNFQRVIKRIQVLVRQSSSSRIGQDESPKDQGYYRQRMKNKPDCGSPRQPNYHVGFVIDQIRNSQFTGRNKTLFSIHDIFRRGSPDDLNLLVLFGMGGVGKTQLAVEFAYQARRNFSSIFWIDGTTEQTATHSIRSILDRLSTHYEYHHTHPEVDPLFKEISSALKLEKDDRILGNHNEPQISLRQMEALRKWLSSAGNREWLIIIDNLDDLDSFDFRKFLPPSEGGSILVTSRRSDLTVNWPSIEITEMEGSEAVELLAKTAGMNLRAGITGK